MNPEILAIVEKTDATLKGGPGSGSWNGPGSPRFQHQGKQSGRSSKEPVTEADKALHADLSQLNSMISQHAPEAIKEYKYKNGYDFILKEGKFYEAAERPKGVAQGTMKECFANAGRLALDNEGKYTYVEGFATIPKFPIPFAHAWCVDNKTGKVVDPTWKDGSSYYGVAFSTDAFRNKILKTSRWGMVPDIPSKKYNPLKTGFGKGEII